MQQQTSDALSAASRLRDLILSKRAETEERRQVADAIVAELVRHKLGRLALPTEHDGLGLPSFEQLPVIETLAQAEASVAWIVWNSSLPCWLSRFLSAEARGEIFAPANGLFASSTRPTGRAVKRGDTYVVNGRWSLVSGCKHASWIPVMCLVEQNGEVEMLAPNVPHMRFCYVPAASHEIVDTWHVGGLRGTGSHDCVLRDEIVPARRTFAFGEPSLIDTPLGRVPIISNMSAGCASICLGIAATALQAVLDLAGKASADGGPGLRDRPPVQTLVARANAKIEALRAQVRSTCESLWRKAEANRHDALDRAAVMSAALVAAHECRTLVSELYAAAGASALYTDSPLERAHRDIHAVTQHIVLQPFWFEQAGRVQFGLEPTSPMFML